MASVNKQSLREEFEALKGRFGQLSTAGKISAESRALIEALLLLLQVLMAVFMEKHTGKTSTNSSKPSSQSAKDETALSRPGTHSKGKLEHESRSANTRTVETTEISKVDFCENCGEDLHKVPCQGYERRSQIDIVFEKVLSHVDAEIKSCPQCGHEVHGAFPEAFSGPVQYGAGIKAFVLNLLIAQMLSLKRVQQTIHTLIGLAISQATVLKYVLQLHLALERWETAAIERLLTAPVMHVDETSLRVDKKNQWIHVCSAGETTLKFVHEKRGLEAIGAIGVIPRYAGVIVHDCWASYLAYDHCGHGLCGAHLLRELTFVVEANGHAWAKNISGCSSRPARKSPSANAKHSAPASTKTCRNATATFSPAANGNCLPSRQGKTANAAESRNPMPIISGSASRRTRAPCCYSPQTLTSPSLITAPNATCA